jgi:hypothetical protein
MDIIDLQRFLGHESIVTTRLYGVARRFVQNCTLSGQGLEHRTNLP